MSKETNPNFVTLTGSQTLKCPDQRTAILLVGHNHENEPFSVAFEATNEALNILRTEVAKAERVLSLPKISVLKKCRRANGISLEEPPSTTAATLADLTVDQQYVRR